MSELNTYIYELIKIDKEKFIDRNNILIKYPENNTKYIFTINKQNAKQ